MEPARAPPCPSDVLSNGARAGLVAAAIGLTLGGCLGPSTPPAGDANELATSKAPTTLPPEGRLLLYTDVGPVILHEGVDDPIPLQPPGGSGWAHDLSPDGTQVLALPFQQEPTGITREPRILIIDTESGESSTVVRVGPRGDLGPAIWSPGGTRIAYRLTVYPVDPARIHPGPHGDRGSHLCVLDLGSEHTRCFPNLRRVDGFDWAPDGETLVVDVVGPSPLWLLDPSTGRRSVLVQPRGGWTERADLSQPVIFTSPRWSPSGRFVSTWAGEAPVVFHADGRLAAVGRSGASYVEAVGWSPAEDLFAYARGHPPEFTEIRLLDPKTVRDRRLFSAQGYPYITGLAWSPSGRWLATLRWGGDFKQVIDVIDAADGELLVSTRRDDSPVLIDWGP